MYKHPLTIMGVGLVAYALFEYFFGDRGGAYIALPLGAFFILIGIIVEGFQRLERLIIFREIDALECNGPTELRNIYNSKDFRKAHLKVEKK